MNINLIILNIALLISSTYVIAANKRYFHMLQLNSYMNSRFFKWFKVNFSSEIKLLDLILVIAIVFLLIDQNLIFLICLISWYTVSIYLQKKRSKIIKKKFVITARVKRLYFSLIFVLILFILGYNFIYVYGDKDIYSKIVITLMMALIIFKISFIFLINTINLPIESLINHWYVSDAKRILKRHKNLKVIGITGSYGKTSTKYILNRILTEKFNVLMTPESYNTLMGVVRTIRNSIKSSHEIFICEMGAKNRGDIKEICQLVNPKLGLITSIGPQHLETFKTLDTIIKTKFELIDSIPNDGTAFLNYENENIKSVKPYKKVISYGVNNIGLNYWAQDIIYNDKGLNFTLCSYKDQRIPINTKLLGMHNVVNIIGACSIAIEIGIEESQIIHAVKQIAPIPHRLELKTQDNGAVIIDNAFNSNPEGANESLNVLDMFTEREKILISPGLVELGEKEYEYNYKFALKALDVCNYIIWVGKKRAIPMMDALKCKKFDQNNIFVAENLNNALDKMKEIITPKSVILFENDLPDNYEG